AGVDAEDVAGDDARSLLAQECSPTRPAQAGGRSRPMAAQQCSDRRGRNTQAELRQFPLNALIAPPRVLARQPENQRPSGLAEGRAARPATGTEGPLPSDELAMPAEQSLGGHQEGAPGLPWQMAARRGQEEAVAPTKPRSVGLPAENLQLMAEHNDLQVLGVLAAPHEPGE